MLYLETRLAGKVARWPLSATTFHIGRGKGCEVVIDDDSVSRRHVRVKIRGKRVLLKDLDSTNGVRVDGNRIEDAEVELGRWFVVGTVLMTVRQGVSLTTPSDPSEPDAGPDSDDSDRSFEGEETGEVTAAVSGTNVVEGRPGSLAVLARRVENARGSDQLLQGLLDHLVECHDVRGTALIERVGNGWTLRGQSGEQLPVGQEEAFLEVVEQSGDRRMPVEQESVLGLPMIGVPEDRQAWLLIYPWNGSGAPNSEVVLIAGLCGKYAFASDGPGSAVTAATESRDLGHDTGEGAAFIAVSESCRSMLGELDRLAATDIPVLLRGESGTGKELLSRRLHERSLRRDRPFVALNCAALPRDLLEAELFGIEKGVATGVVARPGHFLLASGGTLFLDEIGDMPLELQPKVLRALESGEVKSLGAPAPVSVDVRVVASTHQDLERKLDDGTFRRDLYHRIAGAVVRVPPLRKRPEDILPLARVFVRDVSRTQGRVCSGLDLQAARLLIGYNWPGNCRELRHVIARAVALSDGSVLHPGLFPEALDMEADPARADAYLGLAGDFREARRAFDRLYFTQLLARCGNNLSKASRLARLNRSHLYKKLDELGLK